MCTDPELNSGPAHSRPAAGPSCDLLSACSGLAWRTDGGWSGPSSARGGPRQAAASWPAGTRGLLEGLAFECQLSLFAVRPRAGPQL